VNAIAEQRVRPGKTGYWIALLIVVVGVGGSAWLLFDGFGGLSDGLVRAVVPGETQVTLEEGTYTVFHESPSVVDGQTYNAPLPDAAEVFVTSGSERISMVPSLGNYNYNLPGRSGRSIGSFRVAQPGNYSLIVEYPPTAPSDETVIALGHEKGKAAVKIVLGIAGILGSGFIAMLIFLIVVIMRSRSKNRLREAGVQV
jgi:hypothetical protein